MINSRLFKNTDEDKSLEAFHNLNYGSCESVYCDQKKPRSKKSSVSILVALMKTTDIANKNSSFLCGNDYLRLRIISREFYGEITNAWYRRKWAEIGYNFLSCDDSDYEIRINNNQNFFCESSKMTLKICSYGLMSPCLAIAYYAHLLPPEANCLAGTCAVPFIIARGTLQQFFGCIGFFSGALKDQCCSNIRPKTLSSIYFLSPLKASQLPSERKIVEGPKKQQIL